MRERDLLDLAVEVHRVLAHEVHELHGRALGERDAVAHGHRAHRLGQLVALERRAVDDGRLAVRGHRLVQARVLRQLLGDEREHGGLVRRGEVAHELFGVGLLQLVGRAHLDEAHGARERHGVAGRDDVAAERGLAGELVGVERQVAHRRQPRAQALHHGVAFERVLAHDEVDGQQRCFLFLLSSHAPILAQRPDVDPIVGQFA